MVKTATIKISLVKESNQVPNEQIEQEILSHLKQFLNGLPWQETAKSVKISESVDKKKTIQVGVLSLPAIQA